MTGTLVVLAAVLLALAWFFWPSGAPRSNADSELDQAERDVQEAADQNSVRDWGPGTGQKPLP